jgi:hypothetical protein
MKPTQATRWITEARFAPYLAEANDNHERAIALYGSRAEVAALMSKLVPFRNRLAHHETIIRRPLAGHYDDMLELVGLIDTDARTWIDHVSRVRVVLWNRP